MRSAARFIPTSISIARRTTTKLSLQYSSEETRPTAFFPMSDSASNMMGCSWIAPTRDLVDHFSPATKSAPCPSSDRPLEDCVRSPSAKPFARRAQELVASGDLRQAKLQLSLASFKDPDNESLNAAMRDLERRIALSK